MAFARANKLPYFETSAKTGYGIRRVVRYSLKKTYQELLQKGKLPTPAVLAQQYAAREKQQRREIARQSSRCSIQ